MADDDSAEDQDPDTDREQPYGLLPVVGAADLPECVRLGGGSDPGAGRVPEAGDQCARSDGHGAGISSIRSAGRSP